MPKRLSTEEIVTNFFMRSPLPDVISMAERVNLILQTRNASTILQPEPKPKRGRRPKVKEVPPIVAEASHDFEAPGVI